MPIVTRNTLRDLEDGKASLVNGLSKLKNAAKEADSPELHRRVKELLQKTHTLCIFMQRRYGIEMPDIYVRKD